MTYGFVSTMFIYENTFGWTININVFTVMFDQFNTSLLNNLNSSLHDKPEEHISTWLKNSPFIQSKIQSFKIPTRKLDLKGLYPVIIYSTCRSTLPDTVFQGKQKETEQCINSLLLFSWLCD